jgi:broad specificity phosphatase PhoE
MSEKIYWTRHTPAIKAKGEFIGGGSDRDLSGVGIQKAHKLGRFVWRLLENGQIDNWSREIFVSSLIRAQRTAEILNQYIGGNVISDKRLNAQHFGILEGKFIDEILADVCLAKHLHSKLTDGELENDTAPSGESIAQARDRILDFRGEILTRCDGSNPLVVTHGSIINAVLTQKLGIQIRDGLDLTNSNEKYNNHIIVDYNQKTDTLSFE